MTVSKTAGGGSNPSGYATFKRRSKMAKKKLPPSKPRNPYVALVQFKRAGSHEKPYKALRKQQKQQLKSDKGEPFNKQYTFNIVY